MSSHIVGPAPPAPGPNIDVVRVSWTQPRTLICYSPKMVAAWIHWYGGKSHQCFGPDAHCERCATSQPRKWKGYLHVAPQTNARGFFMEVTPTFESLLVMQVGQNANLRGLIMKVSKSSGGAKGRFILDVLERRAEEATMLVERDPRPILVYLWTRNSGSGQPNPESL